MKYFLTIAIYLLLLLLLLTNFSCSNVPQKQDNSKGFYHLADIVRKPGEMQHILKGVDSGQQVILKIEKGTPLPLQIDLDAPLVHLDQKQEPIRFIATQDFYILLSKKGPQLSLDSRSWVDTKNIASVKSLLGFRHGVFKVALMSDESGEALFVLDISTE